MSANVLVVDDSATMRRMIARTLSMSGLAVGQVYEAANGIQALAAIAQYDVAVVILDINMPVMNGIQLITRMRDDEQMRHVPVVIASTEGSQERIQQLVEAGAVGFVRKPFQPEQLRDVLEPILGVSDGAGVNLDAAAEDDDSF